MSKPPQHPKVSVVSEEVRDLFRHPENFAEKLAEIKKRRELRNLHIKLAERR